MKITNCYEAVRKMEELSEELQKLFSRNTGSLFGEINSVETDFLVIKHSLNAIKMSEENKTAYNFALEMIDYENRHESLSIEESLRLNKIQGDLIETKYEKLLNFI